MKKFIFERSKALLVVFLVSLVLFIACMPRLMNNAKILADNGILKIGDNLNTNSFTFNNNLALITFETFIITIMMTVFALNITGFINKKVEFNFLSTGIILILLCISIYTFSLSLIVLLIFLFILNIIGYIGQNTINKKKLV